MPPPNTPPNPTRPATAPAAPATPHIARGTGTHSAFEAGLEFFLAPLLPYLRDSEVSEIMVNGPTQIYIEKAGRIQLTPAHFASEAEVQAAARNIAQFVGQPLTTERPLLDGRLPDGSRVTVVLAPIAPTGTQINIRRFARNTVTPDFLLTHQALTPLAMEFLLLAVKGHLNIVVSGGAGSGKTTLVNVLTNGFNDNERIIVIEDTRELQVQKPHVVQMEARPADAYGRGHISVRDLFNTALRMRPDRIVVGEVRRGETLDMIQAMTSGHHGSLTTLHASTPLDTCHRLETMALMADIAIPLQALRRQIASAIDLVVQTNRHPSGRRLISQISEVTFDEEKDNYLITDLFTLGSHQVGTDSAAEWTQLKPSALKQFKFEGLLDQMQLTRVMLDGKPE